MTKTFGEIYDDGYGNICDRNIFIGDRIMAKKFKFKMEKNKNWSRDFTPSLIMFHFLDSTTCSIFCIAHSLQRRLFTNRALHTTGTSCPVVLNVIHKLRTYRWH